MKKVVFYIDCMRVGCPATYGKSGVLHRLHEGRAPSNIENSCVANTHTHTAKPPIQKQEWSGSCFIWENVGINAYMCAAWFEMVGVRWCICRKEAQQNKGVLRTLCIWKHVVLSIDVWWIVQQHRKKVVLYIDCMRVGCPATYEKVVFSIDCMRVGCPATYETSGVLHRLY